MAQPQKPKPFARPLSPSFEAPSSATHTNALAPIDPNQPNPGAATVTDEQKIPQTLPPLQAVAGNVLETAKPADAAAAEPTELSAEVRAKLIALGHKLPLPAAAPPPKPENSPSAALAPIGEALGDALSDAVKAQHAREAAALAISAAFALEPRTGAEPGTQLGTSAAVPPAIELPAVLPPGVKLRSHFSYWLEDGEHPGTGRLLRNWAEGFIERNPDEIADLLRRGAPVDHVKE